VRQTKLRVNSVGGFEQERFVIDVQLDQLGVGCVNDGLTSRREPVCVLSVLDLPGLVEPVDVRAVGVSVAPFLGVGAHADVAVADSEQCFGMAEVVIAVFEFGQPPRVDGESIVGKGSRVGHVSSAVQ
jgi:hypothetical protein